MKTFKEYINEAAPKMLTVANLVKFLDNEKNWDENKESISDFFERGYDKYYGVSHEILNIHLGSFSSTDLFSSVSSDIIYTWNLLLPNSHPLLWNDIKWNELRCSKRGN